MSDSLEWEAVSQAASLLATGRTALMVVQMLWTVYSHSGDTPSVAKDSNHDEDMLQSGFTTVGKQHSKQGKSLVNSR
jgi:hypothetical protein